MDLKFYISHEFIRSKTEEFSAFLIMFIMLNGELLGLTIWIIWLVIFFLKLFLHLTELPIWLNFRFMEMYILNYYGLDI